MATGLRSFVNRAGSPANAHQSQSSTAAQHRALAGQNAKIQPHEVRSIHATRQPLRSTQQTRSMAPPPAPRPGSSANALVKTTRRGDRYDTDVENFDDSTTTVSEVQVLDNQLDSHGRPYGQHPKQESNYGDDEHGYEEYEEGEEDGESEAEAEGGVMNATHQQGASMQNDMFGLSGFNGDRGNQMFAQGMAAMQQQSRGRSKLDPSINSYPSTTSGLPVEEEQDQDESEEYEDEQTEHGDNEEHVPHQRIAQQPSLGQPSQAQVQGNASNAFAQRSVFQPAVVREQLAQSQPRLTLRQPPPQPAPVQPQVQERVIIPEVGNAPQPNRVSNQGAAHAYGTPPASTGAPLAASLRPGQAVSHQAPEFEEPQNILDYDHEVLVQKPYSELHEESFDHAPVQPASVLPDDLVSSSLEQRVEHVQNLDPARQYDFFASLTMSEWEEAGDWFLDQFSAILKNMKAARKEKRRIAAEFEEEVFRRNEQVARKKRGIDEALEGMKMSGMGVLSGTPKKKRT